jgi:hypothetical protein
MPNLFDPIRRLNNFPLDPTTIQETYDAAVAYVESSDTPVYEGQIIYVKNPRGFYGVIKTDNVLSIVPLSSSQNIDETTMRLIIHDEIEHAFNHPDNAEDATYI